MIPNDPTRLRPGNPELRGTDIETVRTLFNFYKDKLKFVMFISRTKNDPIHHIFKVMETEFQIITQDITKKVMENALPGKKGAQQVLENLLLKFNLKLGGVNHGISTSQAFMQKNNLSTDVVANEWLSAHKMFIGLDLSHPGPQNIFERQADIPRSDPTVVGMSYTMGKHVLKMRGTYWMQESRLTHIKYLTDKVKAALDNFESENGNFPAHVVVFRGGASEGEYAKVANDERSAIQEAFKMVKRPPKQLTIIVCQRGSNYRIVPENIRGAKAPEQNCPAGTVVDKGVMHPTYTEFLLMAHRTIQGTGQPLRCTVVYDKPERIPLQVVEYITYHLCYAHCIVTSPTSIPAPLYAASELAKRGRFNWKEKNFGDGDGGSGGSGGRFRMAGPTDEAGQEHFFVNLSDTLKPTIGTKFWA